MTDESPRILTDLSAWIGKEQVIQDVLTQTLVDRFNATFDREDDGLAPPLIHFCVAVPATPSRGLGIDGHPERGEFLPPISLKQRLWAGGSVDFHRPLRIGGAVLRRSRIAAITEKTGRSGPLCFVAVEHRLLQDGELAIAERQDIVFRNPTTDRPASLDLAPHGQRQRRIAPSPALLFRYSSLTFNAHRTHYDLPYAIGSEGYPGLVVQGPMQASLLCQAAIEILRGPLLQFTFRSVSPLFANADFTLNADPTTDGCKLWTSRDGGPIAMEATARC